MEYLSEYELSVLAVRFKNNNREVLSKALKFLCDFKEEVNSHSDGWGYWKQPVKAAQKLIHLIKRGEATDTGDATEKEFREALTPIKSFYTRRGNKAGLTFPVVDSLVTNHYIPVDKPIILQLSNREYDTVLAALRMWQADVTDDMTETEGIPADFAEIALEHGNALSSEEIDSMLERFQTT